MQIGCGNHFQNCRNRNFDSGYWANFAKQRQRGHLNFGNPCRSCPFHGAFHDWRFVFFNSDHVQFFNFAVLKTFCFAVLKSISLFQKNFQSAFKEENVFQFTFLKNPFQKNIQTRRSERFQFCRSENFRRSEKIFNSS